MSVKLESRHLGPGGRVEDLRDGAHGAHVAVPAAAAPCSLRCGPCPARCPSSRSSGLPEIEPGADLARLIADHALLIDGDIVVVTSKIVSKAEGCAVELAAVEPSAFAAEWAGRWDKDPRLVEVVLRESVRVVRQIGPVLITETRHGFVCANAGVDQSSSGAEGRVLTLPVDPDGSARTDPRRPRRVRPRRRRGDHRHVRPAVARGPDRHRDRCRRAPAAPQLHRSGRPARPRVPGAGDLRRRRGGGGRRTGEGQHQPACRWPSCVATTGSPTTRRRCGRSSATPAATCSAERSGRAGRGGRSRRRRSARRGRPERW